MARRTSASILWPVIGPITTYYTLVHRAIDISADCGTPVVAPVSGRIVWAAWKLNGGGNVMDIDSGTELVSLNHLSGFAVTEGMVVAGQVVAYVGATGNATGCHLHLAIVQHGQWVNPLSLLP
jgi:murein DD-endopeptidase MepM/ murein hydrolase activator NlpD